MQSAMCTTCMYAQVSIAFVCRFASLVMESDDDEVLNASSQSSDHSVLNAAPGRRRKRARVEGRLRSEPAIVAVVWDPDISEGRRQRVEGLAALARERGVPAQPGLGAGRMLLGLACIHWTLCTPSAVGLGELNGLLQYRPCGKLFGDPVGKCVYHIDSSAVCSPSVIDSALGGRSSITRLQALCRSIPELACFL